VPLPLHRDAELLELTPGVAECGEDYPSPGHTPTPLCGPRVGDNIPWYLDNLVLSHRVQIPDPKKCLHLS
jgi:hypothetical protein